MADDDDDYLSDKFLTIAEPQRPKTYAEKRKETLRESLLKNEQNRIKSRRQLELESREEGLSKSLFERAEDDKASGYGPESKALSMMKKMGFKPGQGLGVPTNLEGAITVRDKTPQYNDNPLQGETSIVQPEKHEGQLVNPLPLNEWSGTS
jgi:tRNA nucleotidyltransferase/poly(A) polymerase